MVGDMEGDLPQPGSFHVKFLLIVLRDGFDDGSWWKSWNYPFEGRESFLSYTIAKTARYDLIGVLTLC